MKDRLNTWSALACIGVLFCLASNTDFEMEVIESMPQETYLAVRANLPEGASRSDIVDEYLENREAYDRIAKEGKGTLPGVRVCRADGE